MRTSHAYARSASAYKPPTSRAIAASTRFHGSVLPPGTHGMLPSACCTEAIASIVAATSAGVSTPSTWGISMSGKAALPPLRHRRGHLLAVDDEALAQNRIQSPF